MRDNIVDPTDPLALYPRVMQPHYWDETSMQWMIDERLNDWLTHILGREPFAVQTMFYFKPPSARGQALHQDQFYLRVDPGTCVAAWMAVDRCDEENGCLRIVAGHARHTGLVHGRCRYGRQLRQRYGGTAAWFRADSAGHGARRRIVFQRAIGSMAAIPIAVRTASVAP